MTLKTPPKPALESLPRVEAASAAAIERWLEAHHSRSGAVWLVTFKKGDKRYVPYADIVREALKFGWIDSRPRPLDDKRSMRLLAPRSPKSAWSAANRRLAEALIKSGEMRASGMKLVEAAKKSGAWTKIAAAEKGAIPADLKAALARNAEARLNFDAFPPSSKRIILEWIGAAKKAETRARRVAETVAMAANDLRANHYRQPKSK